MLKLFVKDRRDAQGDGTAKEPGARMHEAQGKQISLTDPETRSMKSRGIGIVGYKVQTAVDTEHHLIVAHGVANTGSDRRQLANISKQAKSTLDLETLEAVAGRGYCHGEEIADRDKASITSYVPKPQTPWAQSR
jgi:hypothetical protein